MIATNTVLDNQLNVNSIHFFWILPLVIYLIAYIIAFSKLKLQDISVYERIALWACILILLMLFVINNNFTYVILMIALFMVSLVCNLYLVQDKPIEYNLTEFYLYISIGGALGGIFSSIISPLIFNNIYEFPLIVIMFLFLIFNNHKRDKVLKFIIFPWEYELVFLFSLVIIILNGISIKLIQLLYLIVISLTVSFRRLYMHERSRSNAIILLILVTFIFNFTMLQKVEYKARNFYGIKTVSISEFTDEENSKHSIYNLVTGNTLHGSQFSRGDELEFEAITYYDRQGSTIGRYFRQNNDKIKTVGVVGLGIGTLSSLSEGNQKWRYFEIDPQVIEIAKNEKYFTMLNKYNHEIIIGDARITLQSEENNYYDVLVLDAYSGDIIPASLLTKEAIELYKSKLKGDGILLFHISNRQYNLRTVLSTVAKEIEMKCFVDTVPSQSKVNTIESEWVIMTNNNNLVSNDWKVIEDYDDFKVWTDDKYSTTGVLK